MSESIVFKVCTCVNDHAWTDVSLSDDFVFLLPRVTPGIKCMY